MNDAPITKTVRLKSQEVEVPTAMVEDLINPPNGNRGVIDVRIETERLPGWVFNVSIPMEWERVDD